MTKRNGHHADFSSALIAWYRASHRDLPWRRTRDPYAIWLSEVMLQQTRVETVIDYYTRFIERYPTIADLAAADDQAVLKMWEGLGYYSRCRNLHKSAQTIVTEHNGVFPTRMEDVVALRGIGRSTAGAILTFAAGQRHPLLDGNVKRVLSRVFDVADDVTTAATVKRLWLESEALLAHAEDAYTFNQAIMELGAKVCTPRDPRCDDCPVRTGCESLEAGTQHDRPVKPARKKTPHYDIGVGVIWKNHKVLIQRRPSEGLLGGLWEFPGGKQEAGETIEQTVAREIAEELSIDVRVNELVTTVRHAYSHFRITLHAFHCEYRSGTPTPRAATHWRWAAVRELEAYAFPKANKLVLEILLQQDVPPLSRPL
jgi:A/G-specific adenine glycosylase